MANYRDEDGPVEGQYRREDFIAGTGWNLFHITGAALVVVVCYLAVQVFINTGRLSSSETWHVSHEKLDDAAFLRIDKELASIEKIANERIADTKKNLEDRLGDRMTAIEKASLAQFGVVATQLTEIRAEIERQSERMNQLNAGLSNCFRNGEDSSKRR